MPPVFPAELISLILSDLTLEKADLAAACLVSRSFLPLAQEHLYHDIRLEFVRAYIPTHSYLYPSRELHTRGLLRTLQTSPELKLLVRRVSMGETGTVRDYREDKPTDFTRLFSGMTMIESLVFRDACETYADLFLAAEVDTPLRRLEAPDVSSTSHWQMIRRYQSSLRELVVRRCSGTIRQAEVPEVQLHLTSLDFDIPEVYHRSLAGRPPGCPAALVSHSTLTLQRLRLRIPTSLFPPLSSFAALAHLHLHDLGPPIPVFLQTRDDLTSHATELLSQLGECHNLTRLTLAPSSTRTTSPLLVSILSGTEPSSPSLNLGLSLPPRLEVLNFLSSALSPTQLLNIVSALPSATKLHALGFMEYLPFAPKRGTGIGARGGSGGRVEKPGEMQALREACRERGIRLVRIATTQ
ncbi:hypothetical protein JCM11251_005233 [Rhodosporidiobolus azoricus]